MRNILFLLCGRSVFGIISILWLSRHAGLLDHLSSVILYKKFNRTGIEGK